MATIKHFKTNVLLKSIIGKDLINDDNIAILELVKNSYDANSKKVSVAFENLKTNDDETVDTYSSKSSKIIVQDFGIGMNEDDLENKWLNIAYSEKKQKKIAYNRVLAGAKGVGRFSCDRLGEYLDIYTKKKGGDIFHLFVDWKSFEIENNRDLEIQKIDVTLNKIPPQNFKKVTGYDLFESGTILEISKLRSRWASHEKATKKWDIQRLIDLKKNLEKLINPNQAFNKNTFAIFLQAEEFLADEKSEPEHKKVNGEIKNKIFEKLDFTSTCISSSIDSTGKIITTSITDKGRDIFILKEKNVQFNRLKNLSVVLYYLNTYSKIYFARQTGIRSVDFGSVYLFINGFRIPPYGDAGDDWLGLEIRKGQGYARFLGTRELIGRIEISDESNQYRIVSSREGLVKDQNYIQLTNGYFYHTLKRLEKYVVEGLDWDRLTKKKGKQDNAEEIDDNNANIKKYISDFEKKVNSKNWRFSPEDERYFEDQVTKNKRILSLIDNIIDVSPQNIIEIYINEELIVELGGQEKERADQEFKKIIENISSLSDENVNTLLSKIEQEKNAFQQSLDKLTKFSPDKFSKETSAAFKQSNKLLSVTSKEIDKNREIINKLIEQKKEAEKKQREEEEKRRLAEEEKRKLEEQLALEKEKNTYLLSSKRSLSEDAKGLIHNVKLTSKRSKQNAQNLYDALKEDKLKKTLGLKWASEIIYNSDKALKISNLITRANFKANADYQDVNIIKYIEQYFDLYNIMYEDNKIKFSIETKEVKFEKRISILDLSLVLDDLISNSVKANAKNIQIVISKTRNNDLKILFSDDGRGVAAKFNDSPDVIFDLGVTTTDGSGIGLNYVRTTLSKMQGTIKFVGNNKLLKGATFEIVITQAYN